MNKNKDWVVVYFHHHPYSMASHNSDTENELIKIRENFIPILEEYGVDLVLTAHSHSYERSKLMKAHYGYEESFDKSEHLISTSSCFYDGSKNSCPYIKSGNEGTVYVVSGSAGKIDSRTQSSYPHNAMTFSDATHGGATLLEVEGNRLDLKWVGADGLIRDKFRMMKDVNKEKTIRAKEGETITLRASFVGTFKWNNENISTRSIKVKPPVGSTTYIVRDNFNCIKDTSE